MKPVNVADYRRLAQAIIAPEIFDFIDGAAADEITKHANRKAFDRITIRPFCLRDVSHIETSVHLFGSQLSTPLLIAPMAFHQLVDEQGELNTTAAAKACGINLVVSCMSNYALEDIAQQVGAEHLWAQLYIFKDRALTQSLIQRIEKAGYKAIVLTVGAPISGKRERDLRNEFTLPAQFTTGNFSSTVGEERIYQFTANTLDASLTWHDVEWVQAQTNLPIILKGILNPLDAEQACTLNVAGIVVSNHGGRQLDTAEAAIVALPEIAGQVAGRMSLFIDGAIERGTDIFKAIALGADAVLIGRPVLWALAVGGQPALEMMLRLLHDELVMTMKLTGCRHIKEIKNFSHSLNLHGLIS